MIKNKTIRSYKIILLILGIPVFLFCMGKSNDKNLNTVSKEITLQRDNAELNVVQIYEKYTKSEGSVRPSKPVYNGKRETATGKIIYIGSDIHGTPSIGLTDNEEKKTYVLAIFSSNNEIKDYKLGNIVTISGNYHIMSSQDEVIIKNSKIEYKK